MTVIIDTNGITAPTANITNTITANTMVDATGNTIPASTIIKGSAKAWVNFNGGTDNTAGIINSSFNVTSVTVNSTGNFTVNITNAFTDANYTPIVTSIRGSSVYADYGYPVDAIALTANTFRIGVKSSVATATTHYRVYAVVFT